MISTGGTVAAAIGALLDAGAIPDVTVAVSHALLVGPATERLGRLPIRRLVATDSVAVDAYSACRSSGRASPPSSPRRLDACTRGQLLVGP